MPAVVALSDAAILYGAQRYFDQLHRKEDWAFHSSYKEEDDKLLFLEFLHNLCLYDEIHLDKRPIEAPEFPSFGELGRFLETVNSIAGSELIAFKDRDYDVIGSWSIRRVQERICEVIASYVRNGAIAKIEAVKIPWASREPIHQDREQMRRALAAIQLTDDWLPFALFVWRGFWYDAVARLEAKRNKSAFAYVAAPGRIAALEAIFNRDDIDRFRFPREAVRALSGDLPGIPSLGYDFTPLNFVSPFEVSALAEETSEMSPNDALQYALRYRRSSSARSTRKDWADILMAGTSTCVVGRTIIQIMRDMVVKGNVLQSVQLRGVPARGDFWELVPGREMGRTFLGWLGRRVGRPPQLAN